MSAPGPIEAARPSGPEGGRRWILPAGLACAHGLMLAMLAHEHVIGTYETETDFYQYYAPDSERIAAGRFPEHPFQGPGYAALVAVASTVTRDALASGKWLSVASAVLTGLLIFLLFDRLFGYWIGVAAQALAPATGVMPVVSISAMTDVPFLALCLATILVVTADRPPPSARAAAAGSLAGAAYLVRYNGVFLLVACIVGIAALDLFDRPLSQRLRLAAVTLATFVLAASPWLYANYLNRGSPFYNQNYLNIAIVFYEGELSQDGTRAMAARFQSLGDVILYDPVRIATHYPVNVASNVARSLTELVAPWIGLLAALGLALVLIRKPSRPVLFLLGSGALFILLQGLSHWEPRYFLFILVIYVGLASHALGVLVRWTLHLRWIPRPVTLLSAAALIAVVWATQLTKARERATALLRNQPIELFEARRFIELSGGASVRILARKPHLPYISRGEWVFVPNVASIDALGVWLDENPVDFVLIGPFELAARPGLVGLRDPRGAPAWLRPVWVSASGAYTLYAPAR